MKGVGGPLLCIGDLLSDVGEGDVVGDQSNLQTSLFSPKSSSNPDDLNSNLTLKPSDLPKTFQDNYDSLNEALAGTDHSWTSLTLKLCTALETANKLVQSTNSHVDLLSNNLGELERVMKRADSAVAEAKAIHRTLNDKEGHLVNENIKQSKPNYQ